VCPAGDSTSPQAWGKAHGGAADGQTDRHPPTGAPSPLQAGAQALSDVGGQTDRRAQGERPAPAGYGAPRAPLAPVGNAWGVAGTASPPNAWDAPPDEAAAPAGWRAPVVHHADDSAPAPAAQGAVCAAPLRDGAPPAVPSSAWGLFAAPGNSAASAPAWDMPLPRWAAPAAPSAPLAGAEDRQARVWAASPSRSPRYADGMSQDAGAGDGQGRTDFVRGYSVSPHVDDRAPAGLGLRTRHFWGFPGFCG
jgi:hypothetical protein